MRIQQCFNDQDADILALFGRRLMEIGGGNADVLELDDDVVIGGDSFESFFDSIFPDFTTMYCTTMVITWSAVQS
ncbi:hypothetical protein [Absidia glauca]|uniref:Uncharacterized protein n=1 Tax=Absidia glauca TaxID=4829 RepID=A0A163JEB9_ABSGL|nr:hypothetical protein [Absidia glauca]